jgi:hypothetical protein
MGSIAPTYALSIVLLRERPNTGALVAVLVVLGGIVLMAHSTPSPVLPSGTGGDLAAAAAAADDAAVSAARTPRQETWAGAAGLCVAVLSSCIAAVFKVLFKHTIASLAPPQHQLPPLPQPARQRGGGGRSGSSPASTPTAATLHVRTRWQQIATVSRGLYAVAVPPHTAAVTVRVCLRLARGVRVRREIMEPGNMKT